MSESSGVVRETPDRAIVVLRGAERTDFVQRMCTNDVRKVADSFGLPAVLTTSKGRIVDVVRVFARGEELVLLGSEGRGPGLAEWLAKYVVMEALEIAVAAGEGSLQLLGPGVEAAAKSVLGVELPLAPGGFTVASAPAGDAIVHVLGRGEPPFHTVEIVGSAASTTALAARLREAGLAPIGGEAWDALRLEAGIPAPGRELTDNANPLEANLGPAVSFTKGCYIGQEVVARLNSYAKVQRHLLGVKFAPSVDPADVKEIFWDLLRVGHATSAARSDRLGATLALAFIKTEYAKPGTAVYTVRDGEHLPGTLCALPFEPAALP